MKIVEVHKLNQHAHCRAFDDGSDDVTTIIKHVPPGSEADCRFCDQEWVNQYTAEIRRNLHKRRKL